LRAIGWDCPEQFFAKPPAPGSQQPPAPDPSIVKAVQAAQATQSKNAASLQIAAMRQQSDEANRALKAADIQSRERQTAAKIEADRQNKILAAEADRQNKILSITQSLAVHPASQAMLNNENPGMEQ
jgi:hypothetical protein